MFRGSMVAIVTPFCNGAVDEKKLQELIAFQIEKGTSAIVPCGTTGESATLTHAEHSRVVDIAIEAARKRVPVIAGTGSNSTEEAIQLTRRAKESGADAALLITPYYNKPTQEGLYLHYKAVAEAVDLPLILYNVPGRTSINMEPKTVERLAQIENIVGIKEASGSLAQVTDIIQRCGDKMTVLSGDDALTLPILAVGGKGVISVAANIVPDRMAELVDSFLQGDRARAMELNLNLYPLFQALFYETNPIPVKTALFLMGKIGDEFRLPLCSMSEWNMSKLKDILARYQLLPE
ncbi:MAG: 4-hydroxy-tetrahydrodipicolinate synthase [bacterium]